MLEKVFKIEGVPRGKIPTDRGELLYFIDKKNGKSNNIGCLMVVMKAGSKAGQYHYHTKRETVYFVLEGEAKARINDKEYILEPNMIMFISPGDKHNYSSIGDTDLKMIECYSPLEPDSVSVNT